MKVYLRAFEIEDYKLIHRWIKDEDFKNIFYEISIIWIVKWLELKNIYDSSCINRKVLNL